MSRAAWPLALTALLLSVTGAFWRPFGAGWDSGYDVVAYNAVYVCVAWMCWRARAAAGMRSTAVAFFVFAVGNVVYDAVVVHQVPEPSPPIADVFYLGFYPLLYVGVLGAVRSRVPRLLPSMWIDGVVAGLGTAAVAAAFVLGPLLNSSGASSAAVVTNLAYPIADLLLLVLLVGAAAVLGLRADRRLVLLAVGLLGYLVADLWYLRVVMAGTYEEGGLLDQVWLVATLVVGLAASQGAAGAPAAVGRGSEALTWRVLALPLACSAASGVVLVVGYGNRLPALAAWFAVGCWAAGIVRTGLTFREMRDLQGVRLQARTDELTGLPNRRALFEAWGPAVRRHGRADLILFDLDGFKEINDSLGHHAGDGLLQAIAVRLRQAVPRLAVFARLGGDEFAVLTLGPDTDTRALADQLHALLAAPFAIEGVRLHVKASFGVAASQPQDTDLAEVLRRADVSMYHAKRQRTGVEEYVDGLGQGMADRLVAMSEFRTALNEGQLLVHLQPQVDPRTLVLLGVEALVRWQHPIRGLLLPADLLPAADQAGLMGPLADTVLELALTEAARWWPRTPIPVSVNLAASNVVDLDLPCKVEAALARHRLPAAALVLEIVEDTLMQDPVRAQTVLTALRAYGVGISIDDYGTGYSSLGYLKDLPADELKIDRVFVTTLLTDDRTRAIVECTILLAHRLALRVVAEGVEDGATLDLLADMGCDAVQGYWIDRPLPPTEFLRKTIGRRDPALNAPAPAPRRAEAPAHP